MKKDTAYTLLSIPFFFLFWELFYHAVVGNPLLLAPPSRVLPTFAELMTGGNPRFFMPLDIIYSLFHYAYGFSLAFLTGFSLGVIIGWFRLADRISYPTVELIRPIPPIAWIPIAILLLKLTHTAAAFIIFIGAFFPVLLNTQHGVKSVEKRYVEAAMTLGAVKSLVLMRKVIIPASMPSVITGVRVGSGIAWMCVVAAELFGVAPYGLGYQIEMARLYHSPEIVIAYMLAIGILGLLLDRGYRLIEGKLLAWRVGLVAI
jgi:NitT/TauT family transport system permease protein